MATTALMPVDPSGPAQNPNRILPIRANLLPTEIKVGRSARRTRFMLVGAVLIVAALCGVVYLYAVEQKSNAEDNFAMVDTQRIAVQKQKNEYNELTTMIGETETLKERLTKALASDLPWATELDTLRATGERAGVKVTAITATLQSAGTTETTPAGGSDKTAVATLTVTGTAPSKNDLAKFVDLLNKTAGVTNPYVTNATQDGDDKQVSFSLGVDLTSDALCGRYSTKQCGGN